jgi:hypothetical protein
MFLMRALFWIAVVAVLLPRTPEAGAPGAKPGEEVVGTFQAMALDALTRVRAELAAQDRMEPHHANVYLSARDSHANRNM